MSDWATGSFKSWTEATVVQGKYSVIALGLRKTRAFPCHLSKLNLVTEKLKANINVWHHWSIPLFLVFISWAEMATVMNISHSGQDLKVCRGKLKGKTREMHGKFLQATAMGLRSNIVNGVFFSITRKSLPPFLLFYSPTSSIYNFLSSRGYVVQYCISLL